MPARKRRYTPLPDATARCPCSSYPCSYPLPHLYQALQLIPSPDFKYLGDSANRKVEGINDAEAWRTFCSSLESFELSAEEMAGVRRALAATLHLGNLQFTAVQLAQQDDGSRVDALGMAIKCPKKFGTTRLNARKIS